MGIRLARLWQLLLSLAGRFFQSILVGFVLTHDGGCFHVVGR